MLLCHVLMYEVRVKNIQDRNQEFGVSKEISLILSIFLNYIMTKNKSQARNGDVPYNSHSHLWVDLNEVATVRWIRETILRGKTKNYNS